jgi:hypothetical protein
LLFRPVYGPELEAIFTFVSVSNQRQFFPIREEIYQAFVPQKNDHAFHVTQNTDDAISFLKAAGLLSEDNGIFSAHPPVSPSPSFPVVLLSALRKVELNKKSSVNPLDPIYLSLLTELFIKPNVVFLPNIHTSANQIKEVKEAGGLGREKLQSWMRVMEFMGVGFRVRGQFICMYHPDLILDILKQWPLESGTLQSFIQDFFNLYLPNTTADGDIAKSLSIPLEKLRQEGAISLFQMQDSPSKPYFGEMRYRGIKRDLSYEF